MANAFNYLEVMQQVKQTIFAGDHSAIYNISCGVACIAVLFSLITWYNKMLNDPYGRFDLRAIIRAAIVLFLTCNFYSFVLVPFDHLTYLVSKSLSASVDEKRSEAFSPKEIIRQVEEQRGENTYLGGFLKEMEQETSDATADGTSLSLGTSSVLESEAEVRINDKHQKGLGARIWQAMKDAFSTMLAIPIYSAGATISAAMMVLAKILQWIIMAVSSIFLIILGLIGPMVFALSLIPGFGNNIGVWLARYIQISFWVPMVSLVDYVNYKITGALVVTMINNPSLNAGAYAVHLILLETVTVVCLLAVPQLSSWVITSAGASDVNRGIATTAQKGAMLIGKFK